MSTDFDLKVSQAKNKISENFVKGESNGLHIGDFHFFMLSKECPIIRSIWSIIRIQHGPMRNMRVYLDYFYLLLVQKLTAFNEGIGFFL